MDARTKRVLIIGVALATLVGVAFAVERWTASRSGDASGYAVVVKKDGRPVGHFTVAQLERLGVKTVTMQGQPETGPTLLSVLSAAGVDSFRDVTVVGIGARDEGRLVLSRVDIDGQVLLDIAKRGTTKVCGPRIPYDKRVRDVTELQVR